MRLKAADNAGGPGSDTMGRGSGQGGDSDSRNPGERSRAQGHRCGGNGEAAEPQLSAGRSVPHAVWIPLVLQVPQRQAGASLNMQRNQGL